MAAVGGAGRRHWDFRRHTYDEFIEQPFSPGPVHEYKPHFIPPYLSNGLIGIRCGQVPLTEGEYSLVVGFAEGSVGASDYNEALLYLHQVKTFNVIRPSTDIIWTGICHLYPSFGWSILDDQQRT